MEEIKKMLADWNEKKGPFVARQQVINARLTELAGIKEAQVLAQVIVFSNKATEAIAMGDDVRAEQLKAEIAKLEAGKIERATEREALQTEKEQVEERLKMLASQVLQQNYGEIQKSCFSAAEQYVDFLDSTWAALQEYQRETGCHLATDLRRLFMVTDHEPVRKLFERFRMWGLV